MNGRHSLYAWKSTNYVLNGPLITVKWNLCTDFTIDNYWLVSSLSVIFDKL